MDTPASAPTRHLPLLPDPRDPHDPRLAGLPLAPREPGAAQQIELAGPETLSTLELLDLLVGREGQAPGLRADTLRLLERFGDARALARASVGELTRGRALTPRQARRLVAAFALGRRLARTPLRRGQVLRNTGEVYDAYAPELEGLTRERFVSVLLDAKNRVLREERISQGTLTSSPVHPREVFGAAIREAAAGLILIHNHPSGDPEPSPDDEGVTRRLVAAGELIGIPILDHVVVGAGCFVSLLERGLIPQVRGLAPS